MGAARELASRPEHMLPIMIVLGIMFIGICIAMNLMSRARFKKRTNVFVAAGRATPNQRRPTSRGPGHSQRLSSYCPSPSPMAPPPPPPPPPPPVVSTANTGNGTSNGQPVPLYVNVSPSSGRPTSGRASVVSRS